MTIELVVARYLEDLAWLRNVPPQIQVTVYDKSPQGNLPNVGREAHTYLHHICARYDSLAEVTVFAQGKPFDHAFDFHRTLREMAQNLSSTKEFRWLGHIIDTDDCNGARLFATWSKNTGVERLDMRGFARALFVDENDEGPDEYTFVLGAQFAVRRELIRSRSLAFWENALQVSMDFPDAAHCFERSWNRVFGVAGIDLEWLVGRKTVYLKPIRRLESGE
jgi:hypothetical protein